MASQYEQKLWEEGRQKQREEAQRLLPPVEDPGSFEAIQCAVRTATEEVAYRTGEIRKFGSGATRNAVEGRPDPEGFISPFVLERFGEYMNRNRVMPNGEIRNSDNWQLGIPKDAYMKSKVRHALTTWKLWRGGTDQEGHDLETSLCAELFNTMGLLHELLKERGYGRAQKEAA